ncbi:MAG: nucleoside triphosphate pyrophosphohydrolase [Saprospiraceae bacterium]|nr:nucleoside triphosphate pyrophosphohydrolase [Saprospiraceae bacterium]
MEKKLEAFRRLLEIMDKLRANCPWDKKQTLDSLRYLTIEETYELSEAILDKDMDGIKNELGDLMLHLVFYSKIGEEKKSFDIADVLNGINEKLVNRHPHIFGDVKVQSAEEVADNWEKIKIDKEGKKSVLQGVPKSLPPLVKAYRMQEKARGVGFDWDNNTQVWDKVIEELNELKYEVEKKSEQSKIENEFGDLLFALVNYSRFINVNPEDALERTNRKFIKRFQYLEEQSKAEGKSLRDMTLEEMDVYWNKAKTLE